MTMDGTKTDSYLFNEMSEREREQFENDFFSDDEQFAELVDRDNDLVDRYVREEMTNGEVARFESTLEAMPARRQKIANARILHEYISDERPESKAITIAERSGVFSRLFAFGTPAFQFASIGAIAILAALSIFLLAENRRLNSLEGELAAAQAREAELAALVESQTEATGDLTRDLTTERDRIAKLEEDLTKARGGAGQNGSSPIVPPTIATLVLSSIGVRGGPIATLPARLDLPAGVTRVSVVIELPADAGERVSVKLNGEEIARNVKVRDSKGEKLASVTIAVSRLRAEQNEIEVIGNAGEQVAVHPFTIRRR